MNWGVWLIKPYAYEVQKKKNHVQLEPKLYLFQGSSSSSE
jgi:hypothetical protein